MAGTPNRKGTPLTQGAVYVARVTATKTAITEGEVLVAARPKSSAGARVSQGPVLMAARPLSAHQERIVQAAMLASVNSQGNLYVRVSQAALLIATKTGVPGQLRQRAWTFDFDGHTFYVLDLAQEGTWLYDFTTQQWTKFSTPGFGVWNMLNGFAWESNNMVVAGDSIQPVVYKLDPTTHLDDGWRPIQYIVTGGISTGTRDSKSIDTVRLSVAAGYETDPMPTMTMRFSDNNAATWSQDYPFPLVAGMYNQVVEWNSLGQITVPGRVFEFRDQGGLVRIDSATMQVEGQE